MVVLGKTNKIQVICPICKTRDTVSIPPSRLNKETQLTTVSVHKSLICPHHFQFFIDKNFQIRGYQKVDLELNHDNSKVLRNGVKAFNVSEETYGNHFQKLIFDGDRIEFMPIVKQKEIKTKGLTQNHKIERKKMSSKEIYEEFWEFIDDYNEIFLDYIANDKRRTKHQVNSKIGEFITIEN